MVLSVLLMRNTTLYKINMQIIFYIQMALYKINLS